MNVWENLDQLSLDDERFAPSKDDEILCDKCGEEITYPFYSLSFKKMGRRNSLDFCHNCKEQPLKISVGRSKKIAMDSTCLLCLRTVSTTIPFTGRIKSGAYSTEFFLCKSCSKLNCSKVIEKARETVYEPRPIVERFYPVSLNIHSAERVVPEGITVTREGVDLWVNMIEDICEIPRGFGSVKQWCVFSGPTSFPEANGVFYLIIDCGKATSGRVGVVFSDITCKARVYILFKTYAEYCDTLNAWKSVSVETHDEALSIARDISRCVIFRRYRKMLKKYAIMKILTDEDEPAQTS